ncbi:hypothetical protein C2E15_08545 [Mixta gaviniae]|uniref:Uncharacterized protein n=1 Tax=Mixta gaviniae TaxID=665914 RepID=A0A2L0IEU1_9GAMM|nr:hypothetical protein C2E15_08545 [Mixta gaviniae]
MKTEIINAIRIFVGILFASSLLSGAGVMFNSWYSLPRDFSNFFVMIFCMLGVIVTIQKITDFIFHKK